MRIDGRDVKIGDVIDVWWNGQHGDRVLDLKTYHGPLDAVFPAGARIATFVSGFAMTLPNDDRITRRNPCPAN